MKEGTIEIQVPGGVPERHSLRAGLSIGSGPTADLRVDAGTGLLPVHVRVVPGDDDVLLEVVPEALHGAFVSGGEQRSLRVAWGEEAYVEGIRLSFLRGASGARGPSPVLLVAALVAFAGLGASAFGALGPEEPSSREVEAPALASVVATCRSGDRVVAEHRARETERAARAKVERFAFDAGDGPEALRLYEESKDCFSRAGLSEDAQRVERQRASWAGRLNEEYGAARLRLRVALDHHRWEDSLSAVNEIALLLGPNAEGPYAEWLDALRRQLVRKVAETKKT